MSLFSKKETKEAKEPKAKSVSKKLAVKAIASSPATGRAGLSLLRPRITEKSSMVAEKNNVYVFEVSARSDKKSIAEAVKEIYKVVPIKIAIAPIPSKQVFVKGKWGVRGGGKKAYVYLAKGDKIEVV